MLIHRQAVGFHTVDFMAKKKKMTAEQRLIHSPSPLHLDACIQGGRIFRNKTKYTRKGKSKFDVRKEYGLWEKLFTA